MIVKLVAVLAMAAALSGCTKAKPSDFEGALPRFLLEEFFAGRTIASGILEDRFANLRRQFVVTIDGTWEGAEFVLDERFDYSDGERQRRVWRIRKIGTNNYEGRADDVVGIANGESFGNVLNWRYEMDLPISGWNWRVTFDDWMYLQPSGVIINRAQIRKLGIEIGTVTIAFTKPDKSVESD
jgi:hypothetical protein